jgi:hypothetical protein
MSRLRVRGAVAAAVALAIAAFAGGTAGAVQRSNLITQTSIGGVTLGETARHYSRTLGSPDFSTQLPGALVRMTFAGGRIHIFLRNGRGVAILTASDQLRTVRGVGPCVGVAHLRRAYGPRLAPYLRGHQRTPVAFRVGRLAFATPAGRVGAVLLARSPSAYLTLLLNSSSCGGGKEE